MTGPGCAILARVRVKLILTARKQGAELPLNYQHAVASFIYAALAGGSAEFASRLHDVGYRMDGRSFKLFTFSRLNTTKALAREDKLILEDPEISLQVSSPVGEFIEHLISGLSRQRGLQIAGINFEMVRAELVPPPIFHERMKFRALSPITETTNGEREHPTFLSLTDDWSEIIQRNLMRKYQALHGRAPEDARLVWAWNQSYIAKAESRGSRLSVLADVHGIKIRGWLAPFIVEGSRELIKLGYEAGFGARNSMGFGMAEVD